MGDEPEQAAGVATEDRRLVVMGERRFDDLREQVADAAADGMRVEVGAEHDPLRAEPQGELLDEVEVVTEAGVEDDVGCELGDVEALARRFES